jgi:DNA repair protein RadA/Sms
LEQRIAEAEKLGFDSIFIPKAGKGIDLKKFKIEILQFERVELFFRHVFSKKS